MENDTLFPDLRLTSLTETDAWHEDSIRRINPLGPALGSAVFPGVGQVMTGHYVKAAFFVALESVLVGQAVFWRLRSDQDDRNARDINNRNMSSWLAQDSATRITDSIQKTSYEKEMNTLRHGVLDSRLSSYNFTVWAAGAYIYNIFDAIQASNYFKTSESKDPGKAALLSAIPGLGLGQIYNGSLSKAGMIMMTQFSLGSMAWNSHRLMRDAEKNILDLTGRGADSLTREAASKYQNDWGSLRYRSFTSRNMYLWYSIFFYFYGIFDATVDAYLHDYPLKMKIEPDLGFNGKEFKLSLYTTF